MPRVHESNRRQPTSIAVEAVIHRADGTVEPLGTVAYWHRNPLKRLLHRLKGQGKVRLTR